MGVAFEGCVVVILLIAGRACVEGFGLVGLLAMRMVGIAVVVIVVFVAVTIEIGGMDCWGYRVMEIVVQL